MYFQEPWTPVIMIGPGTGIAPFRAYVQEMHAKAAGLTIAGDSNANKSSLENTWRPAYVVFFGCRNRDNDFFFRTEWEEFEQAGVINFFPAFSRDQETKV